MTATASGAERTDEVLLERLDRCPLCGGTVVHELDVPTMNARDPRRVAQLREALGTDFFARQRAAICAGCEHVFQLVRPTRAGMELLYADFSGTVAKVQPTPATTLEYVMRHNAQDYVHAPAKTLAFLDANGLLDGVKSALEVRTYGGALPALLAERGIEHVDAAYIQDFDAHAARSLFGVESLVPFSFADEIEAFTTPRERYGLIVMYEGLTHSRDPRAVIRWLKDHLEPGGAAVLFREPNTPRYRRYMDLSAAFNNFHLHLFAGRTIRRALAAEGVDFGLHEEAHPSFELPLYVNVVIGRDGPPGPDDDCSQAFYESWIRRERSAVRHNAQRVAWSAGRVMEPLRCQLRAEWRSLRGG